jgi:hypothetical protein
LYGSIRKLIRQDGGEWGMKRIAPVIVLSAFVVGMFGAAAAASDHFQLSATSEKAAARQYLSIVAPVNAAAAKFNSQANEWSDSTSDAEAEADAEPLISAVLKLNSKLKDDHWPKSSRSAIKILVRVDAALVKALRSLSSVNQTDLSSLFADFQRDQSNLGAAATIVRHDLGLPPVKD